jgi:hypothetical protein
MEFQIGTLDRTGSLYSITTTPGSGGSPTITPVPQGVIYLRKEKLTSIGTVMAGGRDASEIETVFIMRYHPTISTGWQIVTEGTTYRVVKLEELGRRIGWRVWCRTAIQQ